MSEYIEKHGVARLTEPAIGRRLAEGLYDLGNDPRQMMNFEAVGTDDARNPHLL